ncbi:hypothetical protein CF326_g1803 [Tilletia indica]|nr:hypothetical protein CF326_g1803 [Tilletia indica]
MVGAVVVLRSWTRLSRHSTSSSSLILTRSNSDNAPQRSSPSPRRWSQNTTDTQQPRPSSSSNNNNRQRSSSNNNYSYQDRRQQQQQQHPNQQHNNNNQQHRFQNQPRHHHQPQQHSQQQHQAQHRHQQQQQHRHQHSQDRYQQPQDRHQQQDRRQHPQQHSQDRRQQHPQQQQQNHHHDNRRRNAGPPVAAALSAHTHDSAPPPPSNPSDVIDTEWTESSGGGNGNNGDGNDQRGTERSRRPRVANSPYGEGRQGGGGKSTGGGVQGGKSRAARASVAAAIGMKGRPKQPQAAPPPPPKKQKTEVFLPSFLTVSNLARVLGIKLWDLQVRMRNMGHDDIRPDLTLPFTDAELIAAEFNLLAIANDEAAFDIYPRPPLTALSHSNTPKQEVLPLRPPVVTIMGHVDHGKTTLLDKLRSTSVAAGEAGGITQHIGAFSVPVQSSSSSSEGGGVQFVTFLDTPGHAAFTAMRSRGASVTDIVVLVVAADDGVMPQTKEVIELWKELSAREASFDPSSSSTEGDSSKSKGGRRAGSGAVQLVVALSKSDKPTADPERVKRQLLSEGIELEEYGGEVPCVAVSGKSGEGLDLLQDTLVTLAELAELRAEQSGPVEGYVVESKVEKGRGNVATVLVKRGALRVGDVGVAGTTWAKVRSMTDSAGLTLRELRPGQAGVVTGWKELPSAGDEMLGAPLEQGNAGGETAAKRAVENRKKRVEAAKLGEDVAQINEQRRVLAEEQERKKRADFVERQQKRLAEAALAAGKSVEQLIRENKLAGRLPFGDEDGPEGAAAALGEEGKDAAAVEEDKKKELLVIVKADVSGSAEAVIGAISGIGNKEAGVRIVSSGVGEPTEGDLAMARAVGARIIAFNVSVPRAIERAAASYSPPIPVHSSPIIYRLMEYVSTSVGALLPPVRQIRVTGEATIAQIFKINVRSRVFHNVAGCRVTNGTIARSSEVRILRPSKDDGIDDDDDDEDDEPAEKGDDSAGLSVGSDAGGGRKVVWMGKLDSLKHGKNEVPERGKGTECGMSFEGFQNFQEGDVVQCFYVVETPRQLM